MYKQLSILLKEQTTQTEKKIFPASLNYRNYLLLGRVHPFGTGKLLKPQNHTGHHHPHLLFNNDLLSNHPKSSFAKIWHHQKEVVAFDVDPVNYLGLVMRVASNMQVPLAAVPWGALVQNLGTSNTRRHVGSKKFHNCIISPLAVRFTSQPDCSPTPADTPTDPFQHLHLELSWHFRMNMP